MNGLMLQMIRKQKKVTQNEMADAIGISAQTISSWENGWTIPSVDDFKAIATALNYDPVVLFKKVVL